jgi:hypothetical protein
MDFAMEFTGAFVISHRNGTDRHYVALLFEDRTFKVPVGCLPLLLIAVAVSGFVNYFFIAAITRRRVSA